MDEVGPALDPARAAGLSRGAMVHGGSAALWWTDAAGRVRAPPDGIVSATDGWVPPPGSVWLDHVAHEDRAAAEAAWSVAGRNGQAVNLDHAWSAYPATRIRTRMLPWPGADGVSAGWFAVSEPDGPAPEASGGDDARLLLDLTDRFREAASARQILAAAGETLGRWPGARWVGFAEADPGRQDVELEPVWTAPEAPLKPVPKRIAALGEAEGERLRSSGAVLWPWEGRMLLLLALRGDGWIRGALALDAGTARAFSPDGIAFAVDVAARVVDALDRAAAADLLRRTQARQAFLLVLGDRLRELSAPGEIVETVAEALGRHLQPASVTYGEVAAVGETVLFDAGWSDGAEAVPRGRLDLSSLPPRNRDDLGRGLTTLVPAEALASGIGLPSGPGNATALFVPLVRDGRLRAVLVLGLAASRTVAAEDIALIGEVMARLWETLLRVRIEAALREFNATLESRVAERTAELASSERRFRTLFENAPAPIFLLTVEADGTVRYEAVNAATERFLDRAAEAIVGREVVAVAISGDPLDAKAREAAATGRLVAYEMTADIGGEPRTAECVLAPLPTTASGRRRLIGIARDITDQRRAEDQLRQAQKMEAIGQLTGGIAHDFNNLLTGIIGALAMLQKRIDQGRSDTATRYVELAMASANRAAALTHRLLAFSRRQPLEARPVDAGDLVSAMEELLRRTIGEKVALRILSAQGLWLTRCDPHQLENAVLNLVINARDAMPEGGRVTIETRNLTLPAEAAREAGGESGDYVVLSVEDTGRGMAPDVVARAFDPFFTTKPIGQGTGLGLSMIYGFVQQSGGFTTIESHLGRGTTVKLHLPRYEGEAKAQGTPPAQEGTPRARAGETVLVVEDDPEVRGLVLDVLQELGYAALEAPDGPTGLRLLQSSRRVDLLVTDVGLPGMTGHQLAEQAWLRRPGLKVLFMTGYAEPAALDPETAPASIAVLAKPFPVESLARQIRALLAGP